MSYKLDSDIIRHESESGVVTLSDYGGLFVARQFRFTSFGTLKLTDSAMVTTRDNGRFYFALFVERLGQCSAK